MDPTRLEKNDDVRKNFANLLNYIQGISQEIFNSVDDCPNKLRHIFHSLQQSVIKRYPPESVSVVKYTVISGFFFLRFFCPAILGPKLFELMKEHPVEKTARTLVTFLQVSTILLISADSQRLGSDHYRQTLLAKTLQNLSNLCEFGYKEPYMAEMNLFIQENFDPMKSFIDRVSVRDETSFLFSLVLVEDFVLLNPSRNSSHSP